MDKIILKDMSSGYSLTKAEFDLEVGKIVFDKDLPYVVIYCDDLINAIIKRSAAILQGIPYVMVPIKSTIHEQELLLERIKTNFKPMNDGYMIATTGGSTTQSKLVFSTRIQRERGARHIIDYLKVTSNDTMCLLSLAGNGAWINALNVGLISGATILVSNERDIPTISKNLNENKPTYIGSSPMMMAYLMFNNVDDDFGGNLRCWYLGGAPLNKEHAYMMEERLIGCNMINGYFYAEGTQPLLCDINDTPARRIETIGKEPIPNTTRIVDGELQIRADLIINTLLQGENYITEDGWYKSGDLVEEDSNGYYRVIGRSKVLYTYGVNTINPIEFEEIVDSIPGIIKSFCVNYCYDDNSLNNKLIICIKCEDGFDNSGLSKIVKAKVYDCISFNGRFNIRFVKDFPIAYSGKIDRTKLSEKISEQEKNNNG